MPSLDIRKRTPRAMAVCFNCKKQFEELQENLEHQLTASVARIDVQITIAALQKQETDKKKRIQELENSGWTCVRQKFRPRCICSRKRGG
jgi:tRNA G26 N,N-dimethylase Trm1